MKKSVILLLFLMATSFGEKLIGQNIKPNNIIISTLAPDNFWGRYNIGIAYFLATKTDGLNLISLALNGGKTSTNISNQKIQGLDISGELNFYGQVLMSKKWDEYVGLKLSYGDFKNSTKDSKHNSFFIGMSTGMQPVVAKRIAFKISSDLGYIQNGLTYNFLYNNRNVPFYSGFAIIFNVGVGIKL